MRFYRLDIHIQVEDAESGWRDTTRVFWNRRTAKRQFREAVSAMKAQRLDGWVDLDVVTTVECPKRDLVRRLVEGEGWVQHRGRLWRQVVRSVSRCCSECGCLESSHTDVLCESCGEEHAFVEKT